MGQLWTDRQYAGVWLSDVPLDRNEGAKGDCLLCIDIPEDVFAAWEWVEEELTPEEYAEMGQDPPPPEEANWEKPYREAMIPAEIVNRYGPPKIHERD